MDRGSQLDEEDEEDDEDDEEEDDEEEDDEEEDEEEEERRRRGGEEERRRGGEEERGRRRTRQEEATDIKSNNPHLAGGEKYDILRRKLLVTATKSSGVYGHWVDLREHVYRKLLFLDMLHIVFYSHNLIQG